MMSSLRVEYKLCRDLGEVWQSRVWLRRPFSPKAGQPAPHASLAEDDTGSGRSEVRTCFFREYELLARGGLGFGFLGFCFFSFGFFGLCLLLGRCSVRRSLCLFGCSFGLLLRRRL